MTEIEQKLLDALRDFESSVARMGEDSESVDLGAHFSRIESLASSLPPEVSPNLRHYLRSKSYQKARMFLERLEQA